MKSHDKNDMVKALTPRGVNLSDKSFLLVAFFLFFLFAIPFLSAVWWNPFTWFNEDTGEIAEYETPYNKTIEEPILENNSAKKDFVLNVSASDSGNLFLFVDDGSLVSWWRMDDVEETKLVDYTGRNNGTIYGATQVDGKIGKAMKFDGVDDYVDCGNNVAVNSNMTISFWINPSKTQASGLIYKTAGYSNTAESYHIFWWAGNQGIQIGFSDGSSITYNNFGDSDIIRLNEWQLITVVKTGTKVDVYRNSVFSGSANNYPVNVQNTATPLIIGKESVGSQRKFNGSIDEVMFFNRSLSVQEIQSLYTYTTVPTITINSPENITYTESPDVLINITATNDLYIDSIWYNFGEGNTTYTAPFIETFDSGNYTLIAYVNDTYGNLNSTNVSFVVGIGCIESLVNTTKSDWINTTCSLDQMNQSQFWTEYDENNCGTFENVTYYDYRLVGPTYVNSSWTPWIDLECLPTDFYNQSRNLTSTDIYSCANTLTFFEYRDDEDVCDFCTPNLVNSSKTSWVDTTSCIDGLVNQSRNWTQYDYNDCGEVANETFFEYRTTSCGGTVLTAPTISLLNCRIPNTNPLCWFYSFGMSLISKNIILINGGILNII